MANKECGAQAWKGDPSSARLQLPIGRIELPKPNAKGFTSLIDKEGGMQKPMRYTHVHTRPEKMKKPTWRLALRTAYVRLKTLLVGKRSRTGRRLICAKSALWGGRPNTLRMDRAYSNIYTGVVCRALFMSDHHEEPNISSQSSLQILFYSLNIYVCQYIIENLFV